MTQDSATAAPDITVVIPAYNATATLDAQLDAVLAQAFEGTFEVLVVDNNSTDATSELIRARAAMDARVVYVHTADGRGPSHARNVGITRSRSESVACCDADDIVAAGWLQAMEQALQQHEAVAGVLEVDQLNPRELVEGRGRSVPGSAGSFDGVVFAHGASFGIRRSTHLAVGGFDERVRAGEEIDLAIRLLQRGIAFVEVPTAVVHYRYRTDRRSQWNQAFENGRAKPHLARLLRRTAGHGPTRTEGLRSWVWLVRKLPKLTDPVVRVRWWWLLANRCGHIAGSVRYRTVYV